MEEECLSINGIILLYSMIYHFLYSCTYMHKICLGQGKLEDIGYFCLFSRQLQLWKHDLWRKSSWQTTPFCTKLIFSLVILTGVLKIFSPDTQKFEVLFYKKESLPKHACKKFEVQHFHINQWNLIFFFSKTLCVKIISNARKMRTSKFHFLGF